MNRKQFDEGGVGGEGLGWFHQKTSVMYVEGRKKQDHAEFYGHNKDSGFHPKGSGNPMRGLHRGVI